MLEMLQRWWSLMKIDGWSWRQLPSWRQWTVAMLWGGKAEGNNPGREGKCVVVKAELAPEFKKKLINIFLHEKYRYRVDAEVWLQAEL